MKRVWLFGCALILVQFYGNLKVDAKTQDKTALSHYIMGLLYERWNELDSAIEEYQGAEEVDFYSAQIHLKLGTQFLRKQDFAKALYHLELSSKTDPQNIQSRFFLALLYTALNREKDAASQYEYILKNASENDPSSIRLHHDLAEFYFKTNNLDAAAAELKRILELDPNDKTAHYYLGNIFYIQEKTSSAIEEFKKAIEIDPMYAEALNSLGYTYTEEDINLDEALGLIKQALVIDPDNAAYIDSLGWVHFKKGLYNQALEYLEKAIEILPDSEIYEHLGDAYYKLNTFDKATASWQESLRLEPLRKGVKDKIENIEKSLDE